jgi:hypothetical protein
MMYGYFPCSINCYMPIYLLFIVNLLSNYYLHYAGHISSQIPPKKKKIKENACFQ